MTMIYNNYCKNIQKGWIWKLLYYYYRYLTVDLKSNQLYWASSQNWYDFNGIQNTLYIKMREFMYSLDCTAIIAVINNAYNIPKQIILNKGPNAYSL